ncbi:MAG: DarT ssDNA thymidine ADP-ribosyltransferase family protein [Fusobacteriaceae bacterium]
MSIKTSESLLKILKNIKNVLEKNGYHLTIIKHKNNLNIFYQIEGIKENEDKIMLKIFHRSDGNKTIQIVQADENNLLEKLNLEIAEGICLSEIVSSEKKNDMIKNLNYLKEKNIIKFICEDKKSQMFYKIKCLKEGYEIVLTFYSNNKVLLQGVKSEFAINIFDYILINDNKILEFGKNYEKNLLNIIGNLENSVYQRFLDKKSISDEQKAVIESEEDIVVVNAVAGSGKTTTLEGVISRWSGKKILYIVYNKKMKEEAEQRFRHYQNVKIVTGHSMAYEKHSLRNTREGFDIFEISKKMKINFVESAYLAKAFQEFLIGKDLGYSAFIFNNENKLKHLFFEVYFSTYIGNLNKRTEYRDNKIKLTYKMKYKEIVGFLKEIKEEKLIYEIENKFKEIKDTFLEKFQKLDKLILKNSIPETHDYYLKKFQVNREKVYKYDIVMLDEAQDSNDVMIDIIEYKFPKSRKIIVGDTHQQIYSWRGAKNAMEYFSNIEKVGLYNLSVSYRIGQEMANVCNDILKIKNSSLNIVGKNNEQKKILLPSILEKTEGSLTILFRKNFNMILKAIEAPQRVAFLKDINIDKYIDIKYFYSGKLDKIKYLHHLKKYRNCEQLKFYIEEGWEENSDIILGIKLIEYFEEEFEAKMYELKNRIVSYEKYLELQDNTILLLGTIHGSKGYEFDRLMIDLDFLDFTQYIETMTKEEIIEELNLIYVALTRSSKKIYYILEINFLANLLNPIFYDSEVNLKVIKEMAFKEFHKNTIKKIIEERGIKELIHFTNVNNVKDILNNGICSLNYMNDKNIEYIQNDFARFDDEYNYISVSVSFPNYKMLYKKRKESDTSYVILSLNPRILLEKDCLFIPSNAANKKFRGKLNDYSSFSHFYQLFNNSDLNFPKNYPKDSQAEILVKDLIETKHIECIYLDQNDFTEKKAKYKHKNAEHINIQLGQEYFGKRKW